jgi:hypothetical protein
MNGKRRKSGPIVAGLALVAVLAFTEGASAGWLHGHKKLHPDPSEGYALPIENVFQFPAAIVWQPGAQLFSAGVPGIYGTSWSPTGIPQPGFNLSYDTTPGMSPPLPIAGPVPNFPINARAEPRLVPTARR